MEIAFVEKESPWLKTGSVVALRLGVLLGID
jgi:hypothetical protein